MNHGVNLHQEGGTVKMRNMVVGAFSVWQSSVFLGNDFKV